MGDKEPVGEDDEFVSYSEPSRGIYKKLIVRNERLAGAIILGDGAVVPSLLQTFATGMPLTGSGGDGSWSKQSTETGPSSTWAAPTGC